MSLILSLMDCLTSRSLSTPFLSTLSFSTCSSRRISSNSFILFKFSIIRAVFLHLFQLFLNTIQPHRDVLHRDSHNLRNLLVAHILQP